jgi:NADH dehydrogenase FAD-containing subunit
VFAVRQAPVLVDNLLAMHTGTPLRAFEPQVSFVTAVDLGGGDAVLIRGERWIAGRGALLAKRALDEWFLRRHRVPTGSSGRGWGRAVV